MTDMSAPLNLLASFSFVAKPPPRAVPKNATMVVYLPPATTLDPDARLFDGPHRVQTPIILILVLARSSRIDRAADCCVVSQRRDGRERRGRGGGIKALALRNGKVNVVGIVGWLL